MFRFMTEVPRPRISRSDPADLDDYWRAVEEAERRLRRAHDHSPFLLSRPDS